MDTIPNDRLTRAMVPRSNATWSTIAEFALTFDGYEANGSFEKCAEIANARRHETLTDLRTCLFFEQRRWRHFGEEPDDDALRYLRSIVDSIRAMVPAGRRRGS